MSAKTIQRKFHALPERVGSSELLRPLPHPMQDQVDPFLLLDHIGPKEVGPGEALHVGAHPHRGFEPVTLVFEGQVAHRDSAGNEGVVSDGGVQWMTAGKGIVHEEGAPPEFRKAGGRLHMVQLWINLPAADKMSEPKYKAITAEEIPIHEAGSLKLRVIAGTFRGLQGPAETFSPMLILHGYHDLEENFSVELPAGWNSAYYQLEGKAEIEGQQFIQGDMAVMGEGDSVEGLGHPKSQFLILSGQPLNEPVATYGPFVMNHQREILQALRDYQAGLMGSLS